MGGVITIPALERLQDGKAVWSTGASEKIDEVIFCTGYDYTFPFLDKSVGITVKDRGVRPLWRHMYFTQDPTLVFIGLPWKVAPFPMFDCQSRHAAAAFCGKIPDFPSKEEMEKGRAADEDMRFKDMGLPQRYYHQFGDLQWDYNSQLANEAKVDTYERDVMQPIYKDAGASRRENAMTYRKRNYHVFDDGSFAVSTHPVVQT